MDLSSVNVTVLAVMDKPNNKKLTVFVAMSGGVDSSVAAALLKERGFTVVGAHMKCYNLDGCGERDAEDARRVAEQLGILFYTFDFERAYKDRVVKYMVDGYRKGITPNPDVMCNKEIKFGLFLEKALSLGADYVATGHYVRIEEVRGSRFEVRGKIGAVVGSNIERVKRSNFKLLSARDGNKDQSYFLWTLTQAQLKHCLFPIGDYTKLQVRRLAKKLGLLTAEKKDSQGICFLGQVGIEDFLKKYIKAKPGLILDMNGAAIGTHRGAQFYTIGQRHGLTLKYQKSNIKTQNLSDTKAHYVVAKDIKNNTLIVAEGDHSPALFKREVLLAGVSFICNPCTLEPAPCTFPVFARVRYRQPLARAKLILRHSQECRSIIKGKAKRSSRVAKGGDWALVFEKPQKYIAPGQSAVFYNNQGKMLGGGVILE